MFLIVPLGDFHIFFRLNSAKGEIFTYNLASSIRNSNVNFFVNKDNQLSKQRAINFYLAKRKVHNPFNQNGGKTLCNIIKFLEQQLTQTNYEEK